MLTAGLSNDGLSFLHHLRFSCPSFLVFAAMTEPRGLRARNVGRALVLAVLASIALGDPGAKPNNIPLSLDALTGRLVSKVVMVRPSRPLKESVH